MSSHMYGFTCDFILHSQSYFAQIVYVGTRDDDEITRIQATQDWETYDPVKLAEYELKHRDWSKKFHGEKRLMVWDVYGESDNKPSEREILEVIASGQAFNIEHGWDT